MFALLQTQDKDKQKKTLDMPSKVDILESSNHRVILLLTKTANFLLKLHICWKTTFINPASFTFLESAIILSIVVLGGMGSIVGVIMGAFVLILLPEYLRAFSEYRMLVFGGILVAMMVFRPQGLISNIRRTYKFEKDK